MLRFLVIFLLATSVAHADHKHYKVRLSDLTVVGVQSGEYTDVDLGSDHFGITLNTTMTQGIDTQAELISADNGYLYEIHGARLHSRSGCAVLKDEMTYAEDQYETTDDTTNRNAWVSKKAEFESECPGW